jgi:hypothetical protein
MNYNAVSTLKKDHQSCLKIYLSLFNEHNKNIQKNSLKIEIFCWFDFEFYIFGDHSDLYFCTYCIICSYFSIFVLLFTQILRVSIIFMLCLSC